LIEPNTLLRTDRFDIGRTTTCASLIRAYFRRKEEREEPPQAKTSTSRRRRRRRRRIAIIMMLVKSQQHNQVLVLGLLGLVCSSLFLSQVRCERSLSDWVRAVDEDGQPAAAQVPFTSWPATAPRGFEETFIEESNDFLNSIPSIIEQSIEDNLLDEDDGLLFGDDGIWDSDFFGFDFVDIFGGVVDIFSGAGTDLISTLNFFGLE
jgi:hypothetical protein